MPSILFVCTGNRYRSPIAAACFRQCLERTGTLDGWIVNSAGTWTKTGLPPIPNAIRDAKQLGLEIETHLSRQVDLAILAQSELVLVMESGQKEALQIEFPEMRDRIHLLTEIVEPIPYDIPDPLSKDDAAQQEIVREICSLITRGFHAICDYAQHFPKHST